MKELIIIGASGHGRVSADIAKLTGYKRIRFLDDNENIKVCADYDVTGKVSDYIKYVNCEDDVRFFIAIGNNRIRYRIADEIKRGSGKIDTLIHPDAVIAEGVKVGAGSVVMAGTVINSGTVIGEGCIINTASSVDHDCIIGDYVHIAVGAHLAGTVRIGSGTWIGAGATVSNNMNICGDCMIGAGAVVVKNIKVPGVFIGVPAKKKDMEK